MGMNLNLRLNLGSVASTPSKGGGVPPAGYAFLRGKNADSSYSILRGQTSAGVYVNLIGKVA